MKLGAIVLCGGKSTRLGFPKPMLPLGNERMLQRVVRILSKDFALENIAVVAASGQVLPPLPEAIIVAFDRQEGQGPLEGFAAGLRALKNHVDAVFLTGCDSPEPQLAFILKLFDLLDQYDIAVPVDDMHQHPLAACYRMSLLNLIEQLLAEDKKSMKGILEKAKTLQVDAETLREVDPDLLSLKNINTPEDYFEALSRFTSSSTTG